MTTTTVQEIGALIEQQGQDFEAWRTKQEARVADLAGAVDELARKAGRPNIGNASPESAKPAATWIDAKTKREIKAYSGTTPIADVDAKAGEHSLGNVLRGLVMGGHAPDHKELAEERKALGITPDPSGGFTVDGAVSSIWVDKLRSKLVLAQAGMTTIPMETGTLTIAKLTGDPTPIWHSENQPDIEASDPTFGAVTLQARTCACLLRMSVELAQDSANINQMVERALTESMAAAVDSVGLNGITTNAGAAPMTGAGLFGLTGRNSVTSIGAPTNWDFVVDGVYELMADNVPMDTIGAMVGHPALWKKMRKLKTGLSGDQTPLTMPAEVAALPKLWTTAAPTDKAVLGNWSDLVMGVRQQLRLVPVSIFMGTHLQVSLMAYMRVDFAALRAQSFCTLEGITT